MRYRPKTFLAFFLVSSLALPTVAGGRTTRDREVTLPSSTQGISLAGILTLPEGAPRASVVLLSVAGPDDRDLSLGKRGIFSHLAGVLGRQGIASLRFADRGVDGSGGSWLETTFEDRVGDAADALGALSAFDETADVPKGVVGISEGGAIAIVLAARSDDVDFAVAVSSPMEEGRAVLEGQRDRLLAASKLPPERREAVRDASKRLLDAVEAKDQKRVREILSSPLGPMLVPRYSMVPESLDGRVEFLLSAWYRSQVAFDIAPAVRALDVPLFAVYGGLDRVIDPGRSAELLRSRLDPKVREASRIVLEPDLNHLGMPAETGSPAEYRTLPEIVDEALWAEISSWILQTVEAP